ncbi:hypothetical protein Hypma_005912 [Hypsizygus marmoreus]|uniref:Uncharacterized protein n=1 Tax=Hypsizygus marmoreus TaxID=39966 RepID=A0A369KIS7_HYPMA|nr:hypothetical protein Hypma_005912 [Hypsizygus marmoreus]
MSKLTDHKYLVFDVYGTLVDWETGIYNALQPLLSRFPSAAQWSRQEALLAFRAVESDIQAQYPEMPYSDLLAKVHEVLEARLIVAEGADTVEDSAMPSSLDVTPASVHIPASELEPSTSTTILTHNAHTTFGHSVRKWAPFPDSVQALRDLSAHFKLIVLSNVDHKSFAYTHAYLSEGTIPSPNQEDNDAPAPPLYSRPSPNAHPRNLWLPQQTPGSKSPFSLIVTAQDTQAYKPSLDGFISVFNEIGLEPTLACAIDDDLQQPPTIGDVKRRSLIVAQSLYHDHEPAKRLGVRSVWIDRQGAVMIPPEPLSPNEAGYSWRFETLEEMARAVEKELEEQGSTQ